MDCEKPPGGFEGAGGGKLGEPGGGYYGGHVLHGCGAKSMNTVLLKRNKK